MWISWPALMFTCGGFMCYLQLIHPLPSAALPWWCYLIGSFALPLGIYAIIMEEPPAQKREKYTRDNPWGEE